MVTAPSNSTNPTPAPPPVVSSTPSTPPVSPPITQVIQQANLPPVPEWINTIPEEVRNSPSLQKFYSHKEIDKAFGEITKSYLHLEGKLGQQPGVPPDMNNTPMEQVKEYRVKHLGGVAKGTDFKNPDPTNITLPDGKIESITLPGTVEKMLREMGEQSGWSQQDYRQAYNYAVNQIMGSEKSCTEALGKKYGEQQAIQVTQAYEKSLGFLPPAIQESIRQEAGNSPAVREAFAYLSSFFGESSIATPSIPAQANTAASLMAQADKVENELVFEANKDPNSPKVRELTQALSILNRQLYQQIPGSRPIDPSYYSPNYNPNTDPFRNYMPQGQTPFSIPMPGGYPQEVRPGGGQTFPW